jgi:predicted Fe-Mo cluster-binding NifX family protein
MPAKADGCTKVAIPTAEDKLCPHFGHCEQFTIFTIRDNQVLDKSFVVPPPHEPGLLPKWLSEKGVNLIIAGGMGQRAQDFFTQYGIQVVVGAPNETPERVLDAYMAGNLVTGQNVCDH